MIKILNNIIKGLLVTLVIILTGGIFLLNAKVSPNTSMVLVSSSLVNSIKTETENDKVVKDNEEEKENKDIQEEQPKEEEKVEEIKEEKKEEVVPQEVVTEEVKQEVVK